MPPEAQKSPPGKPSVLRRGLEWYKWISLRNKIALWSFLILAVALAVSLRWAVPAYRTAKMWIFIRTAEKAAAEKDYDTASLAYRKALLSGMNNPASWLSLAKFLGEVGSPEVINVWARLASIDPGNPQYRLNQIRDSLKFNRLYQAEETLNELPPERRKGAEFLRLQAEMYRQRKNFPKVAESLEALLAVDPQDKRAAFDLLENQFHLEDSGLAEAARQKLSSIADGPSEFAAPALRVLIAAEAARGNAFDADRLASKLILLPDATVPDRLMHAQLELATSSFSLAVTQENLKGYAASHPESLSAILSWLISSKFDVPATGRWVDGLPASIAGREDVQPAIFQYYLKVGNWDRVFEILRAPNSVFHVPANVIGLASRAIDENRDEKPGAEQTWMQAIYAAERKAPTLRVLSLLASARGWTSATGRALSALTDASPGDPSAWALLVQHENAVRNLPGLYAALQGLMRLNPYDVNIASNWVLAAALVRPGSLDEVLDVGRRTYEATNPSDARAATAYAMALLRVGDVKKAMQIVSGMSLVDRREPQRAIYVGSVLAANGDKEEALDYFARSENLLDDPFPEEITLRRIWKGVALGEATTADEAAKILLKTRDPAADAGKISAELQGELKRRENPEESQRIFESLQGEVQGRRATGPPPEVEKLIRQMQGKEKP